MSLIMELEHSCNFLRRGSCREKKKKSDRHSASVLQSLGNSSDGDRDTICAPKQVTYVQRVKDIARDRRLAVTEELRSTLRGKVKTFQKA